MNSIESALHAVLERNSRQWIDFLIRLVQTPSVIGGECACQAMVREAMSDIGVFDRVVFPSGEPPFHPTGRSYVDRGCVVGKIPGESSAPAFILNAHIDTAPVENPASWVHPPFSGVVEDGKLHGRGSLDDKAGVAMLLLIAEAFRSCGVQLPGDIILQSVIEDEDSGNGTLACTKSGYFADAGIVIDGTWPFRIIEAHLGQIWLTIRVRGVPAPACSLGRGKDPIAPAMQAVEAVRRLVEQKNCATSWRGLASPYFCCLGQVHAGVWAGAVPEECALALQIGFAPPDTPATMLEQVEAAIRAAVAHFDTMGSIEVGTLATPPFANPGNPMVQTLMRTIRRLRGDVMEVLPVTVTGHCDLRHLRKRDGSPANACLYGPGGGGNPHCANEFYILEHFIPVAQNIVSTMLDYYNN